MTQTWALLGVVVGAVLAGGADLLLTWRRETVEARAAVAVVLDILGRAERQIRALLGGQEPLLWWQPGIMAASEPWPAHRGALTARLPRAAVVEVEKAMATLDALNEFAARAWQRSDEFDAHRLRRPAESQEVDPFLTISDEQKKLLSDTAEQFGTAQAALSDASRIRRSAAPTGRVRAWVRWHRRSLFVGALVAAIGVALLAWSRSESAEQQLEHMLAAHLDGVALTACEPVEDHSTRFSCDAVTQADRATCTARTSSSPKHALVAELVVAGASGGCGRRPVEQVSEWAVIKREKSSCAAFEMIKAISEPAPAEQRRATWRHKLWSRLRKGISGGISGGLPDVLVPDSVVPGGSFVDC
jgi:hypothetical protein